MSRAQKIEFIILIVALVLALGVLFLLILGKGNPGSGSSDRTDMGAVKIALLNGCGYEKIATEVKEYLIEKNYQNLDIISWRNVDRDMFIYDKTLIVEKKDEPDKLKYLMGITGIKRRIVAWDENTIEDFYIILGKDYQKYFH